MSVPAEIEGHNSSGATNKVKVTDSGELVIGPLSYSDSQFKELAEPNTAYNFYIPRVHKQFIITGFSLKADRDVSTSTDATVIIYEASAIDTTTVDKTLFEDAMIRGERTGYTNVNILVTEGKWVNGKTTDDDIHVTIFGYYINAQINAGDP